MERLKKRCTEHTRYTNINKMDIEITLNENTVVTRHLIMPNDLNPNHTVFGGTLLAWMDKDLYIFAAEKVQCKFMVTFSIQNVYFKNPAHAGEIIEIHASLSGIRRSSVTVKGKAIAIETSKTRPDRTIIECEITYVAIDTKTGKPLPVFKNIKAKTTRT